MIAKGSTELNAFYLGSNPLSKIYKGTELLWPINNVDFSGVSDIIAFGDSYTYPGLQASPAGTPSVNSYISLLINTIGKGITNRADTGLGIWSMLYRTYNNDIFPRTDGVTCMVGLNDTNRNGSGASFVAFWKEQYRAFLYSQLIASGIAGEDTTGNWGALAWAGAGFNKAHQFGVGKLCAYTQSLYPTSTDAGYTFSDDHVIMGYWISTTGQPAYTYLGTMEIRIDGVLVDTIDCHVDLEQSYPGWENGNSNYLPRVKLYSGLSNGSHTITARMVANPSGGVSIDYLGHFGTDTSDTKPVLLGDVTYITNYAQAAPYNVGSDAAADAVNTAIQELVDEVFAIRPNLPIAIVHTNTDAPALVSGDYNVDGLHWNNSGHDKGYQKFLNRISAY